MHAAFFLPISPHPLFVLGGGPCWHYRLLTHFWPRSSVAGSVSPQPVTLMMIVLMCSSFSCGALCVVSVVLFQVRSSGLVWFVFPSRCFTLSSFGKKKKKKRQPELYFPSHKPWHYFKFYSILGCIFYFFIGLVFKIISVQKNLAFFMRKQMELLFRIGILPWSHHFSEKELGWFDFQGLRISFERALYNLNVLLEL